MKLLVASAVFVCGCGAGESVKTGAPDGSADVSAEVGFAPADAAADAWLPAVVSCEAGTERIEVTDGTGTHTFASACGDAGGPPVAYLGGGEDVLNLFVVGCASAGLFSMEVGSGLWTGPGAAWAPDITYDDGNGQVASYGPVMVDDWPDAGALVSGSFGSAPQSPALSGVFCVRRLR